MKMQFRLLSRIGLGLSLVVILLFAMMALAQSSDNQAVGAIFGGIFLLFALVICVAVYIYMALALQTIAEKTNTKDTWLAWIPIINIFLMLSVAKKPGWWFVLFLVPLVNIVISILVWMEIAKARNKPDWWGILTIVPVVNIIVPGYLAWAD